MSLSKTDEKKLGTYGFHEPLSREEGGYDPEAYGTIQVYRFEANAKGDGLRRRSSGIQLRFQRRTTEDAVKLARKVVKQLNAGENLLEGREKRVICVPTGRPRGRQKAS
jgi:hypothetical protein